MMMSRKDGMDSKKESQLRRSYCRFLEELGMLFKFPHTTIATSIVLCHRFFLCNSLLKHDARIIAAACMFVASKAEENRCDLKDVVVTSYKIIHNKDSEQERSRICKDKVVYEEHEKAILDAEIAVLATLDFELQVAHPYNPLVEGIKRLFKAGEQRVVAQVALTLVNEALRSSLIFLQFEARHVAAGAIFLAAKLLKLEPVIPWREFDDPGRMDDVSNQMLELYDRAPVGKDNVGSSCVQAPKPAVQDNVGSSKQALNPCGLKRKAGDGPDQLAVRKQRRVEYLSEDRRSDRDHKRYDRSYDRERWYPSRHRRLDYDDRSWRRGGRREYGRERVCGH